MTGFIKEFIISQRIVKACNGNVPSHWDSMPVIGYRLSPRSLIKNRKPLITADFCKNIMIKRFLILISARPGTVQFQSDVIVNSIIYPTRFAVTAKLSGALISFQSGETFQFENSHVIKKCLLIIHNWLLKILQFYHAVTNCIQN